jgi:DNA-binding MarR family transcriptional regulator
MPSPSLPPAWNLGFAVSRLGAKIRQVFAKALAPWGLRPVQYGVLVCLAKPQSWSQRALAAAANLDSSDLVSVLDELERRGLVSRGPDAADRRRHVVVLTPAGRTLLEELDHAVSDVNAAFFAGLDEPEQDLLEALLTKVWLAQQCTAAEPDRPR